MKFLIKTAFWLSIVILLLPTDAPKQTSSAPQVSAGEAVVAASAAVSDMRQFCTRQPEACEVGTHAFSAFGQKAQAGAKMLYEYLTEKFANDKTGSIGPRTSSGKPSSQHTLTPTDLAPTWRGPQPDSKRPA